jgi:hypothetical protein
VFPPLDVLEPPEPLLPPDEPLLPPLDELEPPEPLVPLLPPCAHPAPTNNANADTLKTNRDFVFMTAPVRK